MINLRRKAIVADAVGRIEIVINIAKGFDGELTRPPSELIAAVLDEDNRLTTAQQVSSIRE
jgi:arginine utilization protein RocB